MSFESAADCRSVLAVPFCSASDCRSVLSQPFESAADCRSRCGNFESAADCRSVVSQPFESAADCLSVVNPPLYHQLVWAPAFPAGTARKRFPARVKLTIQKTGGPLKDLTPMLEGWSLERTVNQTLGFQATLRDPGDGRLKPFLSPGDEFYGYFDGDSENDGDIKYSIYLTIDVADKPRRMALILLDKSDWFYDYEPYLQLTGLGILKMLDKDSQFMPDLISAQGALATANQGINEMLNLYGIKHHHVTMPDYPIPQYRRQGNPKAWMEALVHVRQAVVLEEDDGLTIKASGWRKTGGARRRINSSQFLKTMQVSKTVAMLRNQFVITRGEPTSSVVAEKKCIGPECLGKQRIEWQDPALPVAPRVMFVRNGNIQEYVLFDELNRTTVGLSGVLAPTVALEFNYVPKINEGVTTTGFGLPGAGGVWTPEYWVKVLGRKVIRDQFWGLFSQYFSLRFNGSSQARYGTRPELQQIIDPLLATRDIAYYYGTKLIEISERNTGLINAEMMPDPWLDPDDTIYLVDYKSGCQQNCYVEHISMSGTRSLVDLMSVELSTPIF